MDVYKKMMNPMEHDMLLAYVYLMYPNMSYRLDDYGRIVKNRKELVMSLIKDRKISSQRGSELWGVSHSVVIAEMNKRRMQVLR
ncbi:hypothetical protein IBTHAUMO2_240077 [Nitrosopumilaceae archaeon]|nr:hypothetical protein [Nitrosopumilus sp.]CAI9831359.1 hypothetical protein IBTHAUMO2_240077 [Nitrosopumilaceae archaeon]MDA7944264.1 hypothetical protein [Nitrosopumilus sp.]MDA7954016.1 hypothetical protein [Nitrosopumilus sp.]MDA7972944.1 hypothetical protein [Nitrosopumilus sp.]